MLPKVMRAMQLNEAQIARAKPPQLQLNHIPVPVPGPRQVLVKVLACGICRTDLHVLDGDLPQPKLPLVMGHQIVGEIIELGAEVSQLEIGMRVGIPWLGGTCGHCFYCMHERENLCDTAEYTGYQIDGGFAEYAMANADYCFALPPQANPEQIAPLLCAGLIGYRAYKMCGDPLQHLGIYGFGAAAHILIQVARHYGQSVYAFTRAGDNAAQQFAYSLGATWAGNADQAPPIPLDAAVIFAPAGELVPQALKHVRRGGRVVCGGIHMSDIPSFSYADLWGERSIHSVANLTRKDGEEFLPLALEIPVKTEVTCYSLEQANEALADLRNGKFNGAAVLIP